MTLLNKIIRREINLPLDNRPDDDRTATIISLYPGDKTIGFRRKGRQKEVIISLTTVAILAHKQQIGDKTC